MRKKQNWLRRAFMAGWWGLFCLQMGTAFALDPQRSLQQYNCQSWSRQNGLPADKVSAVAQTTDGFLWLGTQNGLVRFDGLEFKTFPINLPSARGQDVRGIYPGPNHGLYFVINGGGAGYFDGRAFTAIAGGPIFATEDYTGTTIFAASNGVVWVGSEIGGAALQQGQLQFAAEVSQRLGTVLSFGEDHQGRIYVGTAEHGLFTWVDGKMKAVESQVLQSQIISALAVDHKNRLWIGTGNGLYICENSRVSAIPGMTTEVKALLVDRFGVLWIGTTGDGLVRHVEGGPYENYRHQDGLCNDNVVGLCEDNEGSLWVATWAGLNQLTDIKLPIWTSRDGVAKGSCRTVSAGPDGSLWAGSDNGLTRIQGLAITNYLDESIVPTRYIKLCYAARDGTIYTEDSDKTLNIIRHERVVQRVNNGHWISALGEDASGLLVGLGYSNNLFRLRNDQLVPYEYKSPVPVFYWINNLLTARDGSLWVASKNGAFHITDGVVQHWGAAEGLSGANVLSLCEDLDGCIWAGLATGMACFKNDRVRNLRATDGLADEWVYSLLTDDHGDFWVSSSRGIFRVRDEEIHDFMEGKTNRIVCDLFTGTEAIKSNGRTDQENSGCKTTDGRIWFPCPWGVVMIDPERIQGRLTGPPVAITGIRANGQERGVERNLVVEPGRGELQFEFTAMSFIAPQKIHFRYHLEGFDNGWVEAQDRRQAAYANLKPGRYVFQVIAANADGVWGKAGDWVQVELRPHYYQTAWFLAGEISCGLLVLSLVYAWRMRQVHRRELALQASAEQLESEVNKRTAELATANASLQHEVEEHKLTSQQLAQHTARLEKEIAERQRIQEEMQQIHKQLVEISRQAGMAEVATSVLHNVGNVLNSVNVSANLITDNLRNSKSGFVGKLSALLQEHTADLPTFLTSDPKGSQIPAYLQQLADQLAREQATTIKEVESLRKNIEHIKDIVSMQQGYAKVSGVTEPIKVADLVEDALRMNVGAFARHEIEVVRDYPTDGPVILVEKHKVLQILVNLIRNAKYACDDSGRTDKRVTVRITSEAAEIKIIVADNGVGIAPENLTRIFGHGFTTRKHGHGFGLHSGAMAAREMGGALTVASDGLGCGAVFTLTLPLQPPV